MDRIFKIHCSQISKIMGAMGLTEKQSLRLDELIKRDSDVTAKPLTQLMKSELASLSFSLQNPSLPVTATTFLKTWYADDKEPIFSKYLDKGNYVESDLIDFMAVQLGIGLADRNTHPPVEDDYMIGTCDVNAPTMIIDVKSPWNCTTLQQNIDGIDPDYEYQLRGYMRLYNKDEAILFYGLMNTPAEVNYDFEVSYEHIPDDQRWIAYKITRDLRVEQFIIERVKMCRTWLEQYDKDIKSKIGKLHII